MSPATGTPRSSSRSTASDDPRALARRALGLAVRSSPAWIGGAFEPGDLFESVEARGRHLDEIDDGVIDGALRLLTAHTRPSPITDEAAELLVGLRSARAGARRTPRTDDPGASPDVAPSDVGSSRHERSFLTIVTIEGRGIWIELTGALVEPGCDPVTGRLAQLSGLDFSTAVVDIRAVTALDATGGGAVLQFAEPIVRAGGTVHLVDHDDRLPRLVAPWPCGIVPTSTPPTGRWWT